jgi:hypothetical protein
VRSGSEIQVHWLSRSSNTPRPSLLALLATASAFWLSGVVVVILLVSRSIPAVRRTQATWFALFAFAAAATLCCTADLEPARSWAQWAFGPAVFATLLTYLWLQWALVLDGAPVSRAIAEFMLTGQALLALAVLELGPHLFGSWIDRPLALCAAADLLAVLVATHVVVLRRSWHNLGLGRFESARVGLFLGPAWLPVVALGWTPVVLGLSGADGDWRIPPYFAPLAVLPLAVLCPMVLTWGNLARLDSFVRTLTVALLTGTGLIAIVGWLMEALQSYLSLPANVDTTLNIALGLAALPVFEPARNALQRLVEKWLGVATVDYQQRCNQLADALWQALDTMEVSQILDASAPGLLLVTSIRAWLLGPDRAWRLYDRGTPAGQACVPPPVLLVAEPDVALDPPFDGIPDPPVLCLPVHVGAELRGLLLLGAQQSGLPYRTAERTVLNELSHAVGMTLQRVDRIAARFGKQA